MSAVVATATSPHLFWITSRAAGTAALFLSSLGVCAGLLMSGRFMRGRGADLRPLHEALSLATIAALVVHGLSLIGDKYLHPSLLDVVVPFAGSYKTGWTSLGIIAAWMLILLGPSYYLRRVVGQKRWSKLHRLTAVAWVLGIVHALGEGTDAGSLWFVMLIALSTIPALVLLTLKNLQSPVTR
jgi:sulfoxide reductase heme-binding subunit YedZ